MDSLLGCETRYRDHYERTAAVDREGWKKPQLVSHPSRLIGIRLALATGLIAVATRVAPPASRSTSAQAATTTH